jgi:hypothetical protein
MYGGAAKPILPQLREVEKQLRAHREAKRLAKHIEELGKLIANIEKAPMGEPMRSLKD